MHPITARLLRIQFWIRLFALFLQLLPRTRGALPQRAFSRTSHAVLWHQCGTCTSPCSRLMSALPDAHPCLCCAGHAVRGD